MKSSMVQIVIQRASDIGDETKKLIEEFSSMQPANQSGDSIILLSSSGDHYWDMLPSEGKRIQMTLIPKIRQLQELLRVFSTNLPQPAQQELSRSTQLLFDVIEQHGTTWWRTKKQAMEGVDEIVDNIRSIFESYFGTSLNDILAVVDTNALLANPDIENWKFSGATHFTFVLTPAILSELDAHKINHRNPDVREKSDKLVRKIKDYRRRGPLFDGVTVVQNQISLRAIPTEPDMSKSLTWLDPTNSDDRFLASTLEVIGKNLASFVFVVTNDLNLINKADLAGIPVLDVPIS
ncbi:MAG: hypothetical protein IPM93_13580 [Candidatus Obscuribacter sp.]|nr:hypothetical protein [Candidatus Obscuribacter sp.]